MKNKSVVLKRLKSLNINIGTEICVALSGGADSVCLISLLYEINKEMPFKLSAVHINHNLRGREALRDRDFCISFCKKKGIPLKIFEIEVLKEKLPGESVELAARRLRYKAFETLQADYIATAHTAEDSLETFIINFVRGTGLKGLCGIPFTRDNFIRPIIDFSRADVLNYCNENSLEYVTDSSNLTNDYTRNKIRHNIIPYFKKINPSAVYVAQRNMQLISNDNDYIETKANELYKKAFFNGALSVEKLKQSHSALCSRVIIKYCYEITGRYLDNLHLNGVLSLVFENKTRCELSNGYFAVIKNGMLFIKKNISKSFFVKTEIISIENFLKKTKINNLLLKNAIDYDKIIGELKLRKRLSGDIIRPIGRGVTKKLRKLQSEKQLDTYERENAPVASDENGVVWSYKVGCDERVAVDADTKKVLLFFVEEKAEEK